MGQVTLHRLTHLSHLHERWCQFIYNRCYVPPPKGTVLTLGSIMHYPLFDEFIRAGQSAFNLHTPGHDVSSGWATLVRPGYQSDWHEHKTHGWVLVYYPQQQEGDLLIDIFNNGRKIERVESEEGLCVIYPGAMQHKIEPNESRDMRYSMVLTANRKPNNG